MTIVQSKTLFETNSTNFKTISTLLFDIVASNKLHKFSRVKQIERTYIYIYNVEGQLVEYFQPIFPLRSSNKLKRDNETIYRFRAGIVRARHAISPSRTFRFVEATVVNSFSFLNSSLEFCPDNITSDQFVLIVRYAGHVYAKNSVQPL